MILSPSWLDMDCWSAENVATWVSGLPNPAALYSDNFLKHNVNGKKFAMIDCNDIVKIGISKIGHQELFFDLHEKLLDACNTLKTRNLQRLAFDVVYRSKTVLAILTGNDELQTKERIILSPVIQLVKSLKKMINWLRSLPFNCIEVYEELRHQLSAKCKSIITYFAITHRVSSVIQDKGQSLKTKIEDMIKKCEDLIRQSSDPLIVTTAQLENVSITKRNNESLGLKIVTNSQGVHFIDKIHENSVCSHIGKLEEKDEILLVNGQPVIGWSLKNVVSLLKQKPNEVSLTVKKTPRHWMPHGSQTKRTNPTLSVSTATDSNKQRVLNISTASFTKRVSKHSQEEAARHEISPLSTSDHSVLSTDTASYTGTYDEVFDSSLAQASSTELDWGSGSSKERRQTVSGAAAKAAAVRPTILVTDMWGTEQTNDSSPSRRSVIKPDALHSVKSTPELRSPDVLKIFPITQQID